MEQLVREIFSVLVDKKHLCDYFPHPLPQHFTIYREMKHRILAMKSQNIPINTIFLSQQIPCTLKRIKDRYQF